MNLREAVNEVLSHIPNRNGEYFCFPDVHLLMQGFRCPQIREILNNSAGNFPDGIGVAWALKYAKKARFKGRVRGTDFFLELCCNAAKENLSIFFFGNTKETLSKLISRVKSLYDRINIVGAISPPFHPISEGEDDFMIRQINAANPDILFVSLGAPKQEEWMATHKGKIKALQFGVGAAFDFIINNVKPAPKCMQEAGLEWLFRLPQEPIKTIKRISLFPEFLIRVLIENINGQRKR
ncbi:MAG: WecB/TagA/CpsF family glycosyltransferase [Clostridiales bacterium]|nr:WecB/TagA/CpsF family glycosyltransferase [Clostridiales bacterium]